MNNRRISEEELMQFVAGELDPARKAEVREALAEDANLARSARGMEATIAAIQAGATDEVSHDFNARLRRQMLAETEAARPAPRRRLWRFLPFPLTAAAAALVAWGMLGLLWPGSQTVSTGVAWADVVRAINEVQFFHAVAYLERSGGESRRMEVFYRQPGLWRLLGEGRVLFVAPTGSGVFDALERRWRQESDGADPSLLPGHLALTSGKDRMLDVVLAFVFRDGVPAGEAVKSEQAIAGQGMEVFDYAHDPSQQWVRISVLKESRLPIHMVVYQPDRNASMRVVFDYTTPVPETCFDRARFEKTVGEKHLTRVEDILRAGLDQINAKPTTRSQVFDLKGGYKPPALMSVESADTGDLLVVSRDPRNRSPEGSVVSGAYYKQLFDNWGNTFYRITPDRPDNPGEAVLRQVYAAVPPFSKGEGKHTVTLRYVVWGSEETGRLNYEKVIHEETVDIPPPAAKGIPVNWADAGTLHDPAERAHALYHFHISRSPLRVQLATVAGLLKQRPDDIGLLCDKIRILRLYGLDDDRFWLFEQSLKERALADPFARWDLGEVLGEYLVYLFNTGRRDEFNAILARLEPAKEKLLASTDRRTRADREQFERFQGALPVAMAIPKALEAVEKGPRPTVEMIARSRDGNAWVSIARPANLNRVSSDHSWSVPRLPKDSPWVLFSNLGVGDKVFLQMRGDSDQMRLEFDVMVLPLVLETASAPFQPARISWPMTVKVPAPSADTVDGLVRHVPQWLPEDAKKALADPAVREAANVCDADAATLFFAGKYEPALAAYRRLLDMPRETVLAQFKGDEKRYQENRRTLETYAALCLAHLGRLDEAAAAADRLAATAPQPDPAHPDRCTAGGESRWVRLEMARWLIDNKRLSEAGKLLDQIERERPDWRLFDGRFITTQVTYGIRGWQPAFQNWRAWMYADLTWWRLRQAETSLRIPLVAELK